MGTIYVGTLSVGLNSLSGYSVTEDPLTVQFNTTPNVTQAALRPSDLLTTIPPGAGYTYEPDSGTNGAIGVSTTVTFQPAGSLSGPAITVVETVGSANWLAPAAAATAQLGAIDVQIAQTFEAEAAQGIYDAALATDATLCSNIGQAFNQLTEGNAGGTDGLTNDNNTYTELEGLLEGHTAGSGSQFRAGIVSVLDTMINIAGNWDVTEYTVNGAQVSVFDLWNGFNWLVDPTNSQGIVNITGSQTIYTSTGTVPEAADLGLSGLWGSGSTPTGYPGVAAINGQFIPVVNLLSSLGVGAGDPSGYIIGNSGSGNFIVNGVARPDDPSMFITQAQLLSTTFEAHSGFSELYLSALPVANEFAGEAGYMTVPVDPSAGDFYGTGTSDVLWHNASGEVDTWLMNNGQMTGGTVVSTLSSAWQFAGIGDFTGDGTSDVVWHNTATGEVDSWLITNGHLSSGTAIGHASSAWQSLGTGDFYAAGDGISDLLWRNTTTGEVDIWLMNNGQVYGGTALGSVSSAWQFAGIGDFSGSGTSDILWHNTATGEVDTWLIGYNQLTGGTAIGHASSAWQSLGTGDFTGTGTSDILWRNTVTGEVDTWVMNNNHVSGGTVLGSVSSAWQFAGIGYFTGTGTSDILWRNVNTGEVDTWLISNDRLTGGTAIIHASSAWQPQVMHTG
jgi:hypothetical protein